MSRVINDFKYRDGTWAKSLYKDGVQLFTKSYCIWGEMLRRCKPHTYVSDKNKSYENCEVSEHFKDFQNFTDWYTSQIGYFEGFNLDKDLHSNGNKLYSESTCLLLPTALNGFLVTSFKKKNRDSAVGVTFRATKNRYSAQISIDSKNIYLGTFVTLQEASEAYRQAKLKEALRWVQRLQRGEYNVEVQVIERLKLWSC